MLLALLGACSSQPQAGRPSVPDRPEVQRPDGVEPSGLADIRDELASQRQESRDRENALLLHPDTLTTHPTSTPWYETLLSPFTAVGRLLGF